MVAVPDPSFGTCFPYTASYALQRNELHYEFWFYQAHLDNNNKIRLRFVTFTRTEILPSTQKDEKLIAKLITASMWIFFLLVTFN